MAVALPGLRLSTPDSGRDESFVRPFDYQVPAGSGIRVIPHSDRLHVLSKAPGDVQGLHLSSTTLTGGPLLVGAQHTLAKREPGGRRPLATSAPSIACTSRNSGQSSLMAGRGTASTSAWMGATQAAQKPTRHTTAWCYGATSPQTAMEA